MKMKSTTKGQHSFASVPDVKTPRSSFKRNCGLKTTFDSGYLVPIFCEEVLPGDTIKLTTAHVARLATPLKPVMDNMFLDIFWFFVPNRLVWDNWTKFMGEQRDPGDSTDFIVPQTAAPITTGYTEGSLQDYFGLPTAVPVFGHQSLPLRAYMLIFDEWFRDENLVDSQMPIGMRASDGPDDASDFVLQRRGKRHDYFSSALPWPQKGDAVELGLSGFADVVSDGTVPTVHDHATGLEPDLELIVDDGIITSNHVRGLYTFEGANSYAHDETLKINNTGMHADLASAAGLITINALRSATAIQRLLEKDARGGTRYTEVVRVHFGVTSPDQRLQRPEYLGGGTHMINLTTVPQMSESDGSAQGNLAAFGVSTSRGGSGFMQSFTEHGHVIGLISARADLNYQQGLARSWSRYDKLDYYFPTLAHLGEQTILNKEIYTQGFAEPGVDDQVFGYQERWSEYRYKASTITGAMRSNAASGSLDIWHLAQDFDELPVLNSTFIEENPPVDRIVATPSEPHFLLDAYFDFTHVRAMPTYSVPALTDRF